MERDLDLSPGSEIRRRLAEKLAGLAEGTADSELALISRLEVTGDFGDELEERGLDADAVEDLLLDLNVERCPACGWWSESAEMVLDEDEEAAIGCRSCRPDDEN